MNKDICELSW